MSKKNLIFWFDHPPRVSKGVFNAVSEKWDGDTFYICINDTREERKRLNWDEGGYGKAKLIIMSNIDDSESFISKFISDHQKDIHIFNGYKSKSSCYLKLLIKRNADIVVWAERPGVYGNHKVLKKIFLNLIHQYYALMLRKKVKLFLPLGKTGVDLYSKYGWKADQIHRFLYLPQRKKFFHAKEHCPIKTVKFIYLGRLSFDTKGIDVLMKACDILKNDKKWTLDIAGDYGKDKDKVKDWVKNKKNINMIGSWDINEVTDKLSKYDICIIPSRFDGWNVTVNEALNAGVGVIVSDAAGSEELIEYSRAGQIFKSEDVQDLANKMNNVIMYKDELITEWSKNAINYSELQMNESKISNYFISMIKHYFFDKKIEILPIPWVKRDK